MIQLFCIPYAGSSSLFYCQWKKYLNRNIEMVPIELAGKGLRFGETSYESIYEAAEDVFNIVKSKFEMPYIIFGHSMGSLIAYELIQKVYANSYNMPEHIIFSGFLPPDRYKLEINIESDGDLKNHILKLGGVSLDILKSPEFEEFFLPILKADYKILSDYRFNENNKLILQDVSVFYGKDDFMVNTNEIFLWDRLTLKNIDYHIFEGKHFFINDKMEEVVKCINHICK